MDPYCESGSGSIFSHPLDAQVVCQPPRSPTCLVRPARSARSLGQVPIPCACGLCSILLSPSMGHWKGVSLTLGSRISIASEGDPQCDSDPQVDGKQNTLQLVPVSMYKLCLVLKFTRFVTLVPYLEGFQLGGQQNSSFIILWLSKADWICCGLDSAVDSVCVLRRSLLAAPELSPNPSLHEVLPWHSGSSVAPCPVLWDFISKVSTFQVGHCLGLAVMALVLISEVWGHRASLVAHPSPRSQQSP